MKKAICLLILITAPVSAASALSVRNIQFQGVENTEEAVLLHYFPEYLDGNDFRNEAELDTALDRWKERLEQTGNFREIEITREIQGGQADVTLAFREKIPYSFWIGNFFLGVGRYNLWGKGKNLKFEVGPVRQKVIIEDQMIGYSGFYYSFTLGKEEYSYFTFETNIYNPRSLVRKMGNAIVGWGLLPDLKLELQSLNLFFDETNGDKLGSENKIGLKLVFDRRKGYPVARDGFYSEIQAFYLFPYRLFELDAAANAYLSFLPTLGAAFRAGFGMIGGSVPEYLQYTLRDIDGLRSLTHFPGMTGNIKWDAHAELRWAFWEPIPFVIFDMRLEAVGFYDVGEARGSFKELGSPHHVLGGGLRITMDTFCVRAEFGWDETGNTSVLTGFTLPF